MVAFTDLPKVAWVRTTAVTTVHSGSGTLSKCETAKPDRAAIVTLRESPSCAVCSGNFERSDLHSLATLLITNSWCKSLERQPSLSQKSRTGVAEVYAGTRSARVSD